MFCIISAKKLISSLFSPAKLFPSLWHEKVRIEAEGESVGHAGYVILDSFVDTVAYSYLLQVLGELFRILQKIFVERFYDHLDFRQVFFPLYPAALVDVGKHKAPQLQQFFPEAVALGYFIFILAVGIVVLNFLVDIAYSAIDRRIQLK